MLGRLHLTLGILHCFSHRSHWGRSYLSPMHSDNLFPHSVHRKERVLDNWYARQTVEIPSWYSSQGGREIPRVWRLEYQEQTSTRFPYHDYLPWGLLGNHIHEISETWYGIACNIIPMSWLLRSSWSSHHHLQECTIYHRVIRDRNLIYISEGSSKWAGFGFPTGILPRSNVATTSIGKGLEDSSVHSKGTSRRITGIQRAVCPWRTCQLGPCLDWKW